MLLGTYAGKAQYVTLPDTVFAAWLQNNGFASCINGRQLDTTCAAVVNATGLYIWDNSSLRNLTGIQYFKNLDTLSCQYDSLIYIPSFPSTLTYINVENNYLDSLPPLPAGLTTLIFDNNTVRGFLNIPPAMTYLSFRMDSITGISGLPNSLRYFEAAYNVISNIDSFPQNLWYVDLAANNLASIPALPTNLSELFCEYNHIAAIPSPLPPYLTDLYFGSNPITTIPTLPPYLNILWIDHCPNLTSLPALPDMLTNIDVNNNNITVLPTHMPDSLLLLNCGYNPLDSLPPLNAKLQVLICNYDGLTWLNPFPPALNMLNCAGNLFTSLPPLPDTLYSFDCTYNANLSCLPQLGYVQTFDFYGTAITCLPNYGSIGTSNPNIDTVPLCGIVNPGNCTVYWNISGQAFYDANADCIYDSTDVRVPYTKVQLYSGGVLQQQIYTGGQGYYSFMADSNTGYQIVIDTSNLPFIVSCLSSGYINDTLGGAGSLNYNNNFPLICGTRGIDLGVESIINNGVVPRPGNTITLLTVAGDMSQLYGAHCAAGDSGIMQLVVTGQVTYAGPAAGALTPTSVSNDSITWNIPDFGAVNDSTAFNLLFVVDTNAVNDSLVCITANISTNSTDYNLSNNTGSFCFPIVNSLDPNQKQVYPGTIDSAGQWLTYTIRFQNTGSATAVNIIISDTLDSHLDPSTFTLLAYSAKNVTQLTGNVVTFSFPHINLPDSLSSSLASQGYIQFKIKTTGSVAVGNTVNNTAYIYFDLNAAVVTNTAVATVVHSTVGIKPIVAAITNITIYPNPATDLLFIKTENIQSQSITIYDVDGRLINTQPFTPQININHLSAGVYFIEIASNGDVVRKKFVKM